MDRAIEDRVNAVIFFINCCINVVSASFVGIRIWQAVGPALGTAGEPWLTETKREKTRPTDRVTEDQNCFLIDYLGWWSCLCCAVFRKLVCGLITYLISRYVCACGAHAWWKIELGWSTWQHGEHKTRGQCEGQRLTTLALHWATFMCVGRLTDREKEAAERRTLRQKSGVTRDFLIHSEIS